MAKEVKSFCRECFVCQKAKPSRAPKQLLELFGTVDTQHGAAVAMDVGTLPLGDGGYRYFLLIIDLFSHYIEALPLRDQKAESIVKAFLEGWVFWGHGIPSVLVSDQGKSVDEEIVRGMCKKYGIKKRHIMPYHPEADGMAERQIGQVKQVIRCLLLERALEEVV